MLKALGSRLTYANVVATGALFVALGGGAYALSGVPDRSGVYHGCVHDQTRVLRVVGSSSSCRKAKTVRRGSRRIRIPGESAIAWNQLGRPGLQGLQGAQGVQGVSGQTGDTGATGPSDIYAVGTGEVDVNNATAEVASLTVPAGSYVLGASTLADKVGNTTGTTSSFNCFLEDSSASGATIWDNKRTSTLTDTSPTASLTLAGADTFNAPHTIKVICNPNGHLLIQNTRLWAIKTGSLHATLPLPLSAE